MGACASEARLSFKTGPFFCVFVLLLCFVVLLSHVFDFVLLA